MVQRVLKSRSLLGAVLLASLLAGCGGSPATTVDNGKKMKDLQVTGTNQTGQVVPNEQAFLQQLMTDIANARTTTRSITCDLTGFFVNEKTGAQGSNKAKFAFEKPNKTSITMVESTDAGMAGTKLVWTGGAKIAVKTKLMGFWLKTDLDVHDPRATDQRGFYIDETGITPTMDTLLDPRNQVKLMGLGNMNGVPVAQLSIVSPRSLHGIGHEVYVIDGYKKIPVVREMYDKANKLVFRFRLDNVVLNGNLPSTTFQLD